MAMTPAKRHAIRKQYEEVKKQRRDVRLGLNKKQSKKRKRK